MGGQTKALRVAAAAGLLAVGLLIAPSVSHAAIVRGIQEIVAGVFELPLSTLAGTFTGPPVIGTLMGVVNGAFRGVGLLASGAFDLAASAVPIAKAAAPFVLPFLF